MRKAFGLFAAGVASITVFGTIAVYGQQGGTSNPGASASPGVLYPCTAPSASPGTAASPGTTASSGATPTATASPGAVPQCVTVSIPQGAVGMGPAAYGTNPLQIPAGTTVTWVNNDSVSHTVTADDGSFDSGTLQPGQSFTKTFSVVASQTIHYHCAIHGAASMSGALQVQGNVAAGATPSPSASPSASPSPAAGIAGNVPISTGGGTYGGSVSY